MQDPNPGLWHALLLASRNWVPAVGTGAFVGTRLTAQELSPSTGRPVPMLATPHHLRCQAKLSCPSQAEQIQENFLGATGHLSPWLAWSDM